MGKIDQYQYTTKKASCIYNSLNALWIVPAICFYYHLTTSKHFVFICFKYCRYIYSLNTVDNMLLFCRLNILKNICSFLLVSWWNVFQAGWSRAHLMKNFSIIIRIQCNFPITPCLVMASLQFFAHATLWHMQNFVVFSSLEHGWEQIKISVS